MGFVHDFRDRHIFDQWLEAMGFAMRVAISPDQLSLLETSDETKGMLPDFLLREPELMLVGSGKSLADFRSQIEDLQIRVGFDEEYKPNFSGRILEDLIDKLFQ